MKNFESSLALNGLGEMLDTEFGKWGKLSAEAVDMVLEVSDLESISPELLLYTWAKESCFNFHPMPNTNNQPMNPYAFDIGPGQINMGWCFKSIWVREYSAEGLHYDRVFGKEFSKAFSGSPVANLRMAARRLNARKGDDEEKATLYPGPNSRPNRREGWKKYGELMRAFFKLYST